MKLNFKEGSKMIYLIESLAWVCNNIFAIFGFASLVLIEDPFQALVIGLLGFIANKVADDFVTLTKTEVEE